MQRVNRPVRMLSMLFATLLPATPLLAGEATVAVTPENLDGIQTLDEVIVKGRLDSLSSAMQAVIAAEERFYARYNEINKDDRLDITCRVGLPTGTRIPVRSCQTRLVEDVMRGDAERLTRVADVGGTLMLTPVDAMDASLQAEVKARMLKMVKEDPELLRALLERTKLTEYYEALRAKKLKRRRVFWD